MTDTDCDVLMWHHDSTTSKLMKYFFIVICLSQHPVYQWYLL